MLIASARALFGVAAYDNLTKTLKPQILDHEISSETGTFKI